MSEMVCDICFHHCVLAEGKTGFCRARTVVNGKNGCANYGRITSMAMDPIEKKPFRRFYPGSMILTVGSYGCNLSCPFCQNSMISMVNEDQVEWRYFSPEELCRIALRQEDNLGIAFSYNEPLISYEYIIDCARLLRKQDKKTAVVTNGTVSVDVLKKVIPFVDAMNIDYKGNMEYYQELNGSEEMTRKAIEYACDKCHLEVTTLLIPGKNDNSSFIEKEAQWLAQLDSDIVLHLSRYFPRYKYHLPPTDINVMRQAAQTAKKYLKYVYLGNI